MRTPGLNKFLLPWRALAVIGILFAACLEPAGAAPDRFSGLVVFGDSLSDNGNVGRFSNGPVWVEVLALRIGTELTPSRLGGTNFAVGGARSHGRPVDIRGQFHAFITGPLVRRRATPCSSSPAAPTTCWQPAATAARRRQRPARPPSRRRWATSPPAPALSWSPTFPTSVHRRSCRCRATPASGTPGRMALAFNAALEQALRRVERRADVRVIRLDAFKLSEELIADPGKAGFTNISTPCLQGPCEGALFWDRRQPRAHTPTGEGGAAGPRHPG
ncbi:MAG: SGNH/GDSL hydrolase family protein [Rhodospirillales bacterium]